MRFSKTSIAVVALVAAAAASAQAARWKGSAQADLRSTLKQPPPAQAAQPRQLSEEDRALLRRQLSQPAAVQQRSRPDHPRSWQHP